MIYTTSALLFTGPALEVQLAQAVNLLNLTVLGNPPMLLAADQILQRVPTVLVPLMAISQAATSQPLVAQSRMLPEAINVLPDHDLIQGQAVLALVPVLQNLALLVRNQGPKVLNQDLIVGNPRALNLNPRVLNPIDPQSLALEAQNLWVLRVDHVRSPVVQVQKARIGPDLAAHHQGPRALK